MNWNRNRTGHWRLGQTLGLSLAMAIAMALPAQATQLAVLHLDAHTGHAIALPVLDVSKTREGEAGGPGHRQDALSPALQAAMQGCRERAGGAAEHLPLSCPLPAALVASHHALGSVPAVWHDPRGRRHAVQGGVYFSNAAGDGVGFLLAPSAFQAGAGGTVLTSDGRARFLRPQAVPRAAWQAWPQLAVQTRAWAREYAANCQPAERCRPAATLLGRLHRLRGTASEYRLANGARLQMLGASSAPRPAPRDATQRLYVGIRLWRWQDADGQARQIDDDAQWFSAVELESETCETQCRWQWDGEPQVFEIGGRCFVFGAYAGGTVHGYLFAEATPRAIRSLGGYQWGS